VESVSKWIKGLLSAVIGAAANGVTVVIVAPESFNLESGLPKLISVMAVSAILAAAMYLKQSPLPE
jgi:acyl-coenzyme A synthetase/AMP-(fatty) acid ligase